MFSNEKAGKTQDVLLPEILVCFVDTFRGSMDPSLVSVGIKFHFRKNVALQSANGIVQGE
jgi:hypothetical protein